MRPNGNGSGNSITRHQRAAGAASRTIIDLFNAPIATPDWDSPSAWMLADWLTRWLAAWLAILGWQNAFRIINDGNASSFGPDGLLADNSINFDKLCRALKKAYKCHSMWQLDQRSLALAKTGTGTLRFFILFTLSQVLLTIYSVIIDYCWNRY